MDTRTTSTGTSGTGTATTGSPSTRDLAPADAALRFYLCLADRTEGESIDRFLRHRKLAADIEEAARWADANMRLELALSRAMSGRAA